MGSARRHLLDPGRAEGADERVPAVRRAADPLPVRRDHGALYALPQFLAELAILVAVYGASRRLGFEVRAAASRARSCSRRSRSSRSRRRRRRTTSSRPRSRPSRPACCSGAGRLEPALGGRGGRVRARHEAHDRARAADARLARARARPAGVRGGVVGGVAGFVALGMWGYVLNLVETGHVLGAGTGTVQDRASPVVSGERRERLLPRVRDDGRLRALEPADPVAGRRRRRARGRSGVVVGAPPRRCRRGVGERRGRRASVPRAAARDRRRWCDRVRRRDWGFPIRGPGGSIGPLEEDLNQEYGRISNEDYSAFGPVGIVALLAAVGARGLGLRARVAPTRGTSRSRARCRASSS